MSEEWVRWLADQIGHIRESLGQVQATQHGNRQAVLDLSGRIDRMEQRLDRRKRQRDLGWIRHIPIKPLAMVIAGGALLISGHLTVTEIKGWLSLGRH